MKISYPVKMPFVVSQRWNENPEYYGTIGMKGHNGWDFAVPVGTPIFATHDGIVQFADIDSTMSLTVSIDSLDGTFRTLNCHLSECKVKVGNKVTRGDLIALSGNTGRYTTGPHLHFGVRPLPAKMDNGYNGADDPMHYFDGTYPGYSQITQPEPISAIPVHFVAFQKALNDFQLKEGLSAYPLVGPGTKKALNKYLKSIKYE